MSFPATAYDVLWRRYRKTEQSAVTFSVVGRCERSRMFGVAVTTSSICVGSRCPFVRAGVGAAATQNITDPSLGSALLDLLERGFNARQAMTVVTDSEVKNLEYRQLTVIDRNGGTAHYSGGNTLGTYNVSEGTDCIAAGNILDNDGVPEAMTQSFAANADDHLAERLLKGLEAGLAAGGELGEVKSGALLVVHEHPWPLVDLRCDWADNPIAELRQLWEAYEPQMADYLIRAVDPASAPSYGVPGDT